MQELVGKRIVLGLTGGIACYKSAELLRRMLDHGAIVDVVMTAAATNFITPTTMQALSGRHVWLETLDNNMANSMAHINLSRGADAILIAPASANFLARLANGMADDLLSTVCVASGTTPIIVAPAMNREMWANPATQRNVKTLQQDGITFFGPESGNQACGEVGSGRIQEPADILTNLIAFFQPKILKNKRILLTAGPTSETIDPVRVLTNRSSGRMGYAIAQAAYEFGAQVNLVSGPTALPCPQGVNRINVDTARSMYQAVMDNINNQDIFIAVAAVADWGITNPSDIKLKKQSGGTPPQIEFTQNPDILASVAALDNPPWCVGFAAETNDLADYAQNKRRKKNVPVIVGNLVQKAMDTTDTELIIFDANGQYELPSQDKLSAARQLLIWVAKNYPSN